jgi:putative transposase
MANENPLWGAPRIHGELLKLGFDISEATVQRYMPKRQHRTTRQRWKTFLKNHSAQIVSLDFLVLPTITLKLLHVLVFLSHDRRRIIRFNVTDHPSAKWASQHVTLRIESVRSSLFLNRQLFPTCLLIAQNTTLNS